MNGSGRSWRYPVVDILPDQLHEGENTFEFTCENGSGLGGWWPQWLLYGVTFRVYCDQEKPHPTGRIVSPYPGGIIGDRPTFVTAASGPSPICRVDFVGLYEDFNWAGDGNYRQWQCRYLFGEIQNHIGSATEGPWRVMWDTSWIPTQREPIEVTARITDAAGICYVAPALEGLRLARPYSVWMYRPYDVPKSWSTRAGARHECRVDVDCDLSITTVA